MTSAWDWDMAKFLFIVVVLYFISSYLLDKLANLLAKHEWVDAEIPVDVYCSTCDNRGLSNRQCPECGVFPRHVCEWCYLPPRHELPQVLTDLFQLEISHEEAQTLCTALCEHCR